MIQDKNFIMDNFFEKIQIEISKKIIDDNTCFERRTTVSFTGHRPQKLSWKYDEQSNECLIVKQKIKEKVYNAIKNGYTNFICGMALGLDMIFAETVLNLKKGYPQINLICALPCKSQCKKWGEIYKKRYLSILEKASFIRCKFYEYSGSMCMHERNNYMLKNSSLLIAVFNGSNGGTKQTILSALTLENKVEIINIDENYPNLLV